MVLKSSLERFSDEAEIEKAPQVGGSVQTVAVTAGLCPSCGWCPLFWRTRFQQEWNCANCKPWPSRALVAAMRHVVLHDGEPAWLDEIEPPNGVVYV